MSTFVIWVSEGGLTVSLTEEGLLLEDPLGDEPIQLWDNLNELKRIVEDIELNPFEVGDKVRVKKALFNDTYPEGAYDIVHYIRNNGAMCLEFWEEGGISNCVYTWQDLIRYTPKEGEETNS